MRIEIRTSDRSFGDKKDNTPGNKRIISNGKPPPLDINHYRVEPVLITTGWKGNKQIQRGYDVISLGAKPSKHKSHESRHDKNYAEENRRKKAIEKNREKHKHREK